MKKLKIILCLIFWMIPVLAVAADRDKSAEILCSVTKVIECDSYGDCMVSTAEGINIPQFLKIDLLGKTMADASLKDSPQKSAIRSMIRENGEIIMQGSENGRGFTMVVDETSGKFSATISEDSFGFIVFGACMAM